MSLTTDENIKRIILSLEISSMKDWRLKVDNDILRDFGVRSDSIKSSRIRTIIRNLQNPKNKRKRHRYKRERAHPRA